MGQFGNNMDLLVTMLGAGMDPMQGLGMYQQSVYDRQAQNAARQEQMAAEAAMRQQQRAMRQEQLSGLLGQGSEMAAAGAPFSAVQGQVTGMADMMGIGNRGQDKLSDALGGFYPETAAGSTLGGIGEMGNVIGGSMGLTPQVNTPVADSARAMTAPPMVDAEDYGLINQQVATLMQGLDPDEWSTEQIASLASERFMPFYASLAGPGSEEAIQQAIISSVIANQATPTESGEDYFQMPDPSSGGGGGGSSFWGGLSDAAGNARAVVDPIFNFFSPINI